MKIGGFSDLGRPFNTIGLRGVRVSRLDNDGEWIVINEYSEKKLIEAGQLIQFFAHNAARKSGWWTNLETEEDLVATKNFNVAEKLCLIHSEISEAMEGHRKDLMDDKLTQRKMIEVELADAVIRIADLCGALNLDLGSALVEKMIYNESRDDHKIASRKTVSGKKY